MQAIQVVGTGAQHDVLDREALAFVADLERRFGPRRKALLATRAARQATLAHTPFDFLPDTHEVREADWTVAPAPADLQDRRVEITGPAERKMMINALNAGANVFMADFEDALSPTWANVVEGHANLREAVAGTLELRTADKHYKLNADVATLVVRPRGWHLGERHVRVDGAPVSASLFDFGLAFWHNARALHAQGSGAYFYLPKLESHLEARLWADVFAQAERELGLPRGSTKATVLVETLPAAFEMDEILFELRANAVGLNAGRWDYIFSAIKKLRGGGFVFPDRANIVMTAPFLQAYGDLLVSTCHRRGAHAIGGMAAFIPNRRDPAVTEAALARVREDKQREARQGFDGTWVAHPDLVPVAREVFDAALGKQPHQKHVRRDDARPDARALLDFRVAGAATEAGLRTNVRAALQYTEAWLRGTGAVAIANLMEDAATAEIARSQVWQWVQRDVFPREAVDRVVAEELAALRMQHGDGRFADARVLFEQVALGPEFVEFLTIPAYEQLE